MTDGEFDPRLEVPALLATIAELAPEFRDVYEGNPASDLAEDACALCAAVDRLGLICRALTATTLISAP